MKFKRTFKFLILFIFFSLIIYLSCRIYSGIVNKNIIAGKTEILPDFCFYTLHGDLFKPENIKKGNSAIIVFFNPECNNCTYLFTSITKNADLFNNTSIFFVSDQLSGPLKQLSEKHNSDIYPHIKILYSDYRHIKSVFGVVTVPVTFIYSKDHILLRIFKGEVSVEAILKILNRE
jgi:hypothetical protein